MQPPSAKDTKRISHVLGRAVVERQSFEGALESHREGILPDAAYHPSIYAFADPTEDLVLRQCRFAMFQHPVQKSLDARPTLRRLTLERCHFTASELGPLILEDALIDTIWIHRGMWGPQKVVGCAFNRVVIRGRINGGVRFVPSMDWMLNRPLAPAVDDPFVRANQRYYEGVDWALDIGSAEFTGIEMSQCDIPARLIRRDPETQVVVTRESVHGVIGVPRARAPRRCARLKASSVLGLPIPSSSPQTEASTSRPTLPPSAACATSASLLPTK